MVTRTLTNHFTFIVNSSTRTWCTDMGGTIVVLVVGAHGTVLAIEVGIRARAVFALLVEDIVDLLLRAAFACHLLEIPVLGMLAQSARFLIPELVLCLVTYTLFKGRVVYSAILAIFAYTILFVLALGAE